MHMCVKYIIGADNFNLVLITLLLALRVMLITLN